MIGLHGLKGRIVSAIAGLGAVSSSVLFAAQEAKLFTLIPAKYATYQGIITVGMTFIVLFSERVQGGASKPEVREEAQKADDKALIDKLNTD